jgi:hypothetical protein
MTAKTENVIVMRKGPDNQPRYMVIDLRSVLNGEQMENDVYLMPSDMVYVPKTSIAIAGDFVDQYMRRVFMLDHVVQGAGNALGFYFVRQKVYNLDENDSR